jgi:hypothetical protein
MTEILSCFPAVEHRGYFGPEAEHLQNRDCNALYRRIKKMLLLSTLQRLPSLDLHQQIRFRMLCLPSTRDGSISNCTWMCTLVILLEYRPLKVHEEMANCSGWRRLERFGRWQEKMESSWLYGTGRQNQKASVMDRT